MWYETHSLDYRLTSTVAEALVKNSELLQLYNDGKKEECYEKLMRSIDKNVEHIVKDRVETEHKLRLLGLLPDQLTDTFAKWIRDNVKNPLPRDIRNYKDVVLDAFMKVYEETIEEEIPINLLFEFWDIYQYSEDDNVPFEEELGYIVAELFHEREVQISMKL